ncbi:hypothetical protein [uncultured Roseibium sp.]|uniref:hypothetical protein n=1 Tax=uncultured Roseibium sp. TaxID=1936171 RepID=UPI0026228B11|nr:hypothetical protein [uncultured Roseibium sp.]
MSIRLTFFRQLFLAGTCASCFGTASLASDDAMISAPVEHMATEDKPAKHIDGSEARLSRTDHGAAMTLKTSELVPGNVTTAWWVIMTRPENCSATPCTAEDVIGRAAEVGTQIVYADGTVNGPDGTANFAAYLSAGDVPGGWFDQTFDAPGTTEIHLVLNDHGPLIPDIAASMLTSYRGGCSDDSLPPPFPDTAKADGTAGPNACRLIQDAIFPARVSKGN